VSAAAGSPPGDGPTPAEFLPILDGIWAAFNARDWDAFYSLTTEDYSARTDPRWPGGGGYHGREETERFLGQFLEPWEELRYERRADPVMVGGRAVERGAWLGTGRSTGLGGEIEFTVVATMRDGLLARSDFFIDHNEALAFARGEAEGA
jgi:hypothetical protein